MRSTRALLTFITLLYSNYYYADELKPITGKGKYPDATFDYLFVRPKSISSKPTITPVSVSDHYPVVRTIIF